MAEPSCIWSWRHAPDLDNPICKLIHSPTEILRKYIEPNKIMNKMFQIVWDKDAREGLESHIVTYKIGKNKLGIS